MSCTNHKTINYLNFTQIVLVSWTGPSFGPHIDMYTLSCFLCTNKYIVLITVLWAIKWNMNSCFLTAPHYFLLFEWGPTLKQPSDPTTAWKATSLPEAGVCFLKLYLPLLDCVICIWNVVLLFLSMIKFCCFIMQQVWSEMKARRYTFWIVHSRQAKIALSIFIQIWSFI